MNGAIAKRRFLAVRSQNEFRRRCGGSVLLSREISRVIKFRTTTTLKCNTSPWHRLDIQSACALHRISTNRHSQRGSLRAQVTTTRRNGSVRRAHYIPCHSLALTPFVTGPHTTCPSSLNCFFSKLWVRLSTVSCCFSLSLSLYLFHFVRCSVISCCFVWTSTNQHVSW